MNHLGAFGLLLAGILVAAFLVFVPTVVVLLGRKLITGKRVWAQGRVRDWLLSLLIAPLMIAAFAGSYFYAASKGIDEHTIVKWMNILFAAVFVFGFAVKKFWQFRKKWAFWAELCILIVAHITLLSRLHWQQASYFWLLVVVGLPEMFVVFVLLGLMFKPNASSASVDRPA